MNQFTLQQGNSEELELFPHIKEFALSKNTTVQLDSFTAKVSDNLQIYYILDGKFEWLINHRHYTLYPGDVALVLPGQEIGGSKGILDIGTHFRLFIEINQMQFDTSMKLGTWSGLAEDERATISELLQHNNAQVLKMKGALEILHELRSEILSQEIGHHTRVNHLLDSLLIIIARHSTRQSDAHADFSRRFMVLEQTLRQKLGHQWTVEEMAALFGLGTTAFTEKVKNDTGFSPMNYLINVRISEAIKLLKKPEANFTSIALETGFYSSQHFSTTFKKLTGYTPGQFRKRNVSIFR